MGDRVEVEARLPNKDIGFIEAGQSVEIKIETFNFTRYGLIRGRVDSVSQDSISNSKIGDRPGNMSGMRSSDVEPTSQDLIFVAKIILERDWMEVDGKRQRLGPGLGVTVEIRTGARRVIEFVLSPVFKYQHDTGRER